MPETHECFIFIILYILRLSLATTIICYLFTRLEGTLYSFICTTVTNDKVRVDWSIKVPSAKSKIQKISKVLTLGCGLQLNIAVHALPAASSLAFLILVFPVHSTSLQRIGFFF